MTDTPEKEWFAEWFNHPLYLKVYSHRDETEANTCLATILQKTNMDSLTPEDIQVLDIACGAGRHALEFARRGYMTTANDLSPFLLECTQTRASEENLSLACTRQDMRHLSADNAYDLIVQLFSSFGYFKTRDEDLQVLRNVHHALKPDGWYVLDLINPVFLKKNLTPFSSRTIDDLTITETRSIENDCVRKQITISSLEETLSFEESVRLYKPETIKEMLDSAGFTIMEIYGEYEGSAFDEETSPRMMLFARKKRSESAEC
ncbi:MAG: class I SAM-dependent methyltransferase [Chlorobium phaeobacteroides]|uniref:Methyltransferase type 11 n=1 Tax=Chlorobium phaeobacteroides (strain BS1) TaxID=331678 RepID=B3EJ36_CHLPB|nr:class I SAM-dependent methyltransferase [Chlorobium phaeobacteroides]MBL6957065.1 class I SAM-dependent methyltransferase [Chlorobium phaeobacteroides]